MNIVCELIRDEAGASLTEYAMLLALIAVAVLGAIQALRDQIVTTFNNSTSTLEGVGK